MNRWGTKLSLLLLVAVAGSACEDTSRGVIKPNPGDTGCIGPECEGAGGGDMGDAMRPPPSSCVLDTNCPEGQYCEKAADALEGICVDGCRAASCAMGQVCIAATHLCGCAEDAGCPMGEVCEVETGLCGPAVVVCDPNDPVACPQGEVCNVESGACVGAAVCCNGAVRSTCGLVPAEGGACDGSILAARDACDPNPCGPACAIDGDCGDDRFCSVDDSCIEGCREGQPSDCPDGLFCDPDKHSCEQLPEGPCQMDLECPDGTFCDVGGSGMCEPGCRANSDDCEGGLICDEMHICVACEMDLECGPGNYCDPDFGCREDCIQDVDCADGEYCDVSVPDDGRCVEGCRDNEFVPPNRDPMTAAEIPIVNSFGQIQGALVCGNSSDFFKVNLVQGARMQVDLAFDDAGGDLKLRLYDDDGVTVVGEAIQPGSPKRLRHTSMAGLGVERPGDYYIEVYSEEAVDLRFDVTVVVIDSLDACFPDQSELENGGMGWNNQDNAMPVAWAGIRDEEVLNFRGSICGADEDWFVFPAHNDNAGLSLELNVAGLLGGAVVEIYATDRLRLGLGNPNYATGAGVVTPQGTSRYTLSVARDSGGLSNQDYFIRVRGQDRQSVLDDYGLIVNLLASGDGCELDAAEPNDQIVDVGPNADLDLMAGISAAGLLRPGVDLEVPVALSLCIRETDYFHFTAEGGEQIAAWALSDGLAGEAVVEIIDAQGALRGQGGRMTPVAAPRQAASYNGAPAGEYHVRVRALNAGMAREYTLFINRSPTMACGSDVAEVGAGGMRNDTFATAVSLAAADGAGNRFEESGVICNVPPNTPDLDWYEFDVPVANSRICSTVGFNHGAGDLDLRLFQCDDDAAADLACNNAAICQQQGASNFCLNGNCGCRSDADCDIDGRPGLGPLEGRCVASRCRLPLSASLHDGSPEVIDVSRGESPPGCYSVLVSGAAAIDQNAYDLQVTVSPPTNPCVADWQEQDQDNDDQPRAVELGGAEHSICDAWVCSDERGVGDWYALDIPPGEDRTIFLSYAVFTDGLVLLTFIGPDEQFFDMASEPQFSPQVPSQCLNVHAGAGGRAYVLVTGDAMRNNGDDQIDYSLRILPTDLDAEDTGKCLIVGDDVNIGQIDLN